MKPDIKLYRLNKTLRGCGCCGAKSNVPITRLYALSIGYITQDNSGHANESVLCESCLNIVSDKIWNVDLKQAEQRVYKRTDYHDLPRCCGDCKEVKCKLPINIDGEVCVRYDKHERHEDCPLYKI